MIEILREIVTSYLIPAVVTALGGFVAYVGTRIKKIYEEKVKNETVRKIVDDVVAYVERTAKSEENTVKFNMALEKAAEWITSKGFEIDGTELALLIEASVNKLPKSKEE